jgi:UDP-N-acetylmuramyl pentapeptide phosphotransferase/UDP-N-acetylglucosamine-1-phosphate transferase
MSGLWLGTVIGLICGVVGALLAIRMATSWRLWDSPEQRRLHTLRTPRGGGIGIAFALCIALIWNATTAANPATWWPLVAAFLIVAVVGFWDDVRALSWRTRIFAQIITAAIFAYALAQIGASQSAVWFAAVGFPVALNFSNFMDGCNGMLVLTAAVFAAMASQLFEQNIAVAMLSGALLGGVMGFARFNLPNARVFLGDVGSTTIGAAFWLIAMMPDGNREFAPSPLLFVLAPFTADASASLITRLIQKKQIQTAHREHLYQWLVRTGISHTTVSLAYAFLALLLAFLGMRTRYWNFADRWLLLGALTVGLSMLQPLLKKNLLQQRRKRTYAT